MTLIWMMINNKQNKARNKLEVTSRLQNACIFYQNGKEYEEYLSYTTIYTAERVVKPQYIVTIVEYE